MEWIESSCNKPTSQNQDLGHPNRQSHFLVRPCGRGDQAGRITMSAEQRVNANTRDFFVPSRTHDDATNGQPRIARSAASGESYWEVTRHHRLSLQNTNIAKFGYL